MKNTIATTKNFVRRNKNAIKVGAVLTTVIMIQHSGIKSLNGFLQEKNLFDEYYHMNEI